MKLYQSTEIMEYLYESKEEKYQHKREMEFQGYEDSGQIQINIGLPQNSQNEWYGKYIKTSYCDYEEYKNANLRLAQVQKILENEKASFVIEKENYLKEQRDLERWLYDIEQRTGWSWI